MLSMKLLLFVAFNVNIISCHSSSSRLLRANRELRHDDHQGGDDDYEPSENDIDVFFDLCNEFLDTMNKCGEEWISTEDLMIEQIGEMSDRIVYTETLILDEAEEIGYMADRIVDTEYILSNLTAVCMPMCNATMVEEEGKSQKENDYRFVKEFETDVPIVPQGNVNHDIDERAEAQTYDEVGPIALTSLSLSSVSSSISSSVHMPELLKGMCSPLSAFNEVLNESLLVFDQLCENITDGIDFMTLQIGVMADRIVATECLIMDMSKQIGIMADRIVATENLMSNLSTSCCQMVEDTSSDSSSQTLFPLIPPTPSLSSAREKQKKSKISSNVQDPPTPPECVNYTNFTTSSPRKATEDITDRLSSHKLYEKFHHQRAEAPVYHHLAQPQILDRFEETQGEEDNDTDKQETHKLSSAVLSPSKSSTNGDPMPCETWWNPFCCAMEIMTEMMKDMIDAMGVVGDQIIHLMESSALLIGELADDIVDMEHEIMDMALIIGEMGDDIVDIETWGEEFFNSVMCTPHSTAGVDHGGSIEKHESSSLLPSAMTPRNTARKIKHNKHIISPEIINKLKTFDVHDTESKIQLRKDMALIPSFNRDSNKKKDSGEKSVDFQNHHEKGGAFGDFTEMVDLMIKMADTMSSLMSSELGEMTSLAQACTDMADQIVKTMGLIGDMAEQINIMSVRIVQTAQLMENLVDDCVP